MGTREVAALVLITFSAYYNSLSGGFHFDDQVLMLEQPFVTEKATLTEILKYNLGRPLTLLSFRWNYRTGKDDPFTYHLFNVLNHCLNVILLYCIINMILRRAARTQERVPTSCSFLPSVLFAVHPLHTQAVNYVWARSSLLATSFFLLALICYIHAGNQSRGRRFATLALSLVCYLLAIGSKPIALTLPAIILLYDCLLVGRFDWTVIRRRLGIYSVYFLVAIIVLIGLIPELTRSKFGVGFALDGISAKTFFMTQLEVVARYLGLLIYPANLNLDHDFPLATSLVAPVTAYSLLLHTGLILYGLTILNDKPLLSFSILWFYVTLIPTSSFVPVADVFVEHHTYLPSIGFFLAAASLLASLARLPGRSRLKIGIRPAVTTIAIVLATAAFVATIVRNRTWKDDVALWQDVVRKSPRKARPHNNLGHALFSRGFVDQALAEFEDAARIDPSYADPILNSAVCYLYLKNYDKAVALAERCLLLRPNEALAHYNLGRIYQEQAQYDRAVGWYLKAIQGNPRFKEAHINLGVCYLATARLDSALDQFQRVLQLDGRNALAHYNLAVAHARRGDSEQALKAFQTAIEFKPNFYEAHNDLGVLCLEKGLVDEAVRQLKLATQIYPARSQAYINLGLCFAQRGAYDEAIAWYQKAMEHDPGSATLHYNLATSYALKGELEKAHESFRAALRIDPEHARARTGLEQAESKLKAAEVRR